MPRATWWQCGDNNVFPLENWTATHRIYIFHSHGALQVLTFVTPLFVETKVDTNSSRTRSLMSHRACCHTCYTIQLMHYSHFKSATQSLHHLKPIKC
jgi:hypothetical protein